MRKIYSVLGTKTRKKPVDYIHINTDDLPWYMYNGELEYFYKQIINILVSFESHFKIGN